LAGLAAGDADAGLAFVRRFQRRIFGLALTILGDTAAAEDVAQEVLLRAWRHAQAYDPRRGSVATWVLSISRNQPADPETVAALLAGSSEGPADDTILDPQTASDVRQALRDLPTDQRRALMLAAFAGHSAAEIAGIEGIPIGTAKTRVRTAMHKLRAALSEIGDQR
jgi:RNA polymerase sigma factor (sigma-70 family)